MWGASLLCAQAAARCGAGYVYLAQKRNSLLSDTPDFLTIAQTQLDFQNFSAVAIGPGLDKASAHSLLRKLLKSRVPNVVVDASALDVLTSMKISNLPKTWILTPHEGELSRLLGIDSEEIRSRRLKSVRTAQKKFGCVVLLKGHRTLVADSQGCHQITTGNASLAKAGTGDVLTGMITAFLSQGLEAKKAALLAAHIHGSIADQWLKNKNDILSLMASDLIAELPKNLAQLRKS